MPNHNENNLLLIEPAGTYFSKFFFNIHKLNAFEKSGASFMNNFPLTIPMKISSGCISICGYQIANYVGRGTIISRQFWSQEISISSAFNCKWKHVHNTDRNTTAWLFRPMFLDLSFIWSHNASIPRSRDVTDQLWWRHNAKSEKTVLSDNGEISVQ